MSKASHIALVILAGAAVAAGVYLYTRQPAPAAPMAAAGMVRRTEIRLAPEVNGRLAQVNVAPGQHVAKGDLLAVVDNPDLVAALGEAQAALESAQADRANVYAGVRAEEIDIAAGAVETAEANLRLAQQQNTRVLALSQRGFNSGSQLDESNASLAKATADLDLKRAQLAADKAGPTAEERTLADAKLTLAASAVADAEATLAKTRLLAPQAGIIGTVVAEIGEVLTPGKPVAVIVPEERPWASFVMREDELRGMTIGSRISLSTGGASPFEAVVSEMRPLGEFATWRAARAVGDHDLNSFSLRLDPGSDVQGLEPGMSVFIKR
jgi:multidrug resistance efflux pump